MAGSPFDTRRAEGDALNRWDVYDLPQLGPSPDSNPPQPQALDDPLDDPMSGDAMDADREFHFLTELRFLGDAAAWHAATIRELAASWTAADTELHRPAQRTSPGDQLASLSAGIARKTDAQFELFARVDAFLAVYGRMALTLFPQRRKAGRQEARAVHLRALMGVATSHPLSDREFRNKWFHFDELLDEPTGWHAASSTLQLFTRSDRVTEIQRRQAARLFIVDTLTVRFAGVGEFELGGMFDVVADIYTRAGAAIDSWGERWVNDDDADDDVHAHPGDP